MVTRIGDYILEFVPKEFQYLTQQPTIPYKGINLKCSYLTHIIHELIIKYYFSFNTEVKFNLSSVILRKKYAEHYNYYIEWLCVNGFMIMVSNYYNTKKSRTYKIDSKFIDDNPIRYKNYDTFLLKKQKHRYETTITGTNTNTIPVDIKKKLISDIYKIKLDYNKAVDYINDLKNNNLIDEIKYTKNMIAIKNINNGDIYFNFDDFGRFHNNFTCLKKEIRNQFLTINNEILVEVDVKNSQPFFLSVMLKQELLHINNDTKRYLDLTVSGLLYEDIVANSDRKDRSEAKDLIYKVLFGDNKDNKKLNRIFKKLYPSVYEYILEFKNILHDKYQEMSHELQRMESKFIFNTVIKEIYEKYPDIILFTVHDSIIFPKSYQIGVEEIFNNNFNKLKEIFKD